MLRASTPFPGAVCVDAAAMKLPNMSLDPSGPQPGHSGFVLVQLQAAQAGDSSPVFAVPLQNKLSGAGAWTNIADQSHRSFPSSRQSRLRSTVSVGAADWLSKPA